MKFSGIFGLAMSYLWQRKLRSFLTILGVTIGVSSLTLLVAFGLGLQDIASKLFGEDDDLQSTIQVYEAVDMDQLDPSAIATSEPEDKVQLDQAGLERLAAIPGVESAVPGVSFEVLVEFGSQRITSYTNSLQPGTENQLQRELAQGKVFSDSSAEEIVISHEIQTFLLKDTEFLSLVGKEVTLRYAVYEAAEGSDRLTKTGERERRVKVAGVITKQGNERKRVGLNILHEFSAYIPPDFATVLWNEDMIATRSSPVFLSSNEDRRYGMVWLRLEDPSKAEAVKDELSSMGLNFLYLPDVLIAFKIILWFFTAVLAVVGGVGLLVAMFGIINTLVMSILERVREIGIMRSLGATNGNVTVMVMLEGSMIGVLGGITGFFGSWVLSLIIDALLFTFLAGLDVEDGPTSFFSFQLWLVGGTIAFSTFIAWFASIYPAWRATRIDPVEALRRE